MVVRELITMLGFDLKDGPLQKYDKKISATKEKSNGLATAAKGIGSAYKWAAAAVAVGVGWISKNIIDATLEMEGYRSQIQAFTGDADSAAETLAELRDKTIDPLFGTGNLVKAYKQLRTVGMGAEETSRMIDVLGDIANGSAENFNALSNVLVRVSTTGKVDTMTLRQLANAGFGAQDMAQGLGISTQQLQKDLESGKMTVQDLTRAMAGATAEGGRFYMNAANQALTLNGAIKILQDTISSMGDAIGTKILPALANFIGYITNLIKLGQDNFINFGAKAFDYLIHIIAQVIIFFEVLQMRMRKFGVSLAPLVGIFRDVFGFLGRIIRSAAPAVQNLGIAIIAAFEPIRAFVRPILEALEPIIKRIFEKLAGFLESLIPRIKGLTPLFGTLGKFIGNLIGPLLGVGLGIKAINTAMKIGKGVKIFAEGLSLLSNGAKAGNLLKMSMAMQQMGASQGIAQRLSETFALLTGKMDLATAAANKNKLALIMQAAASIKAKIAVLAHAAAEKIRAIATKIAAVAQGILNAVMAANPIAIIILAVVALIAVIVLLVKNWDKVGPTIMGALKAVGNFFKMVWGTIVGFFKKVAQFIKANALKIVTILGLIFFTIPTLIALVVALIIKHWDKIKTAIIAVVTWVVDKVKQIWQNFADFMSALWEGIKNVAAVIWDGVKAVFLFVIDAVKAAWQGFSDFIAGLWEGIKIIASTVWNGITAIVSSVIETIKGLWQGFVDFFSGLFTWIGDMASGVWDRIKESFTAVFDGIKQKFLGFIEVIQTGWEKVKGFFGGIGEGVVNFFTGGDKDSGGSGGAAEKTASSTGTGSLAQTAAATAAARNTYNNGGNTQTINSSASINLTVPPGTSTQQAEFLTREVDRAVQESLASAIGGSRGAIPSPEARRN